jgi:hypothetical protein
MTCGAIPQQHLAFRQRLMHEAKRVMLEIAQASVNELGRGRGRAGGKIVLLDQEHAQAAAGSVARDTGSVDAAADDGKIEVGHLPILSSDSIKPDQTSDFCSCRAIWGRTGARFG